MCIVNIVLYFNTYDSNLNYNIYIYIYKDHIKGILQDILRGCASS